MANGSLMKGEGRRGVGGRVFELPLGLLKERIGHWARRQSKNGTLVFLLFTVWALVSEGWAEVAGSPGVENEICPGLEALQAEEGAVSGPVGPSSRVGHG